MDITNELNEIRCTAGQMQDLAGILIKQIAAVQGELLGVEPKTFDANNMGVLDIMKDISGASKNDSKKKE